MTDPIREALAELVACKDAAGPNWPSDSPGYRWHDAWFAARAALAQTPAQGTPIDDAEMVEQQLRRLDRKGGLGYDAHEWIAKAADTIEQQAATIAALTEERKDWARTFMLDGRTPWEWENMCKRAEAESAKLRRWIDDVVWVAGNLQRRLNTAEAECERLRALLDARE